MMEILYSMTVSLFFLVGGFCKTYYRREVDQWKF